jgi:hypothetical protein
METQSCCRACHVTSITRVADMSVSHSVRSIGVTSGSDPPNTCDATATKIPPALFEVSDLSLSKKSQ